MAGETAAGFWSYSHEDNELDGGAILDLASLIMEEYNLISGEPLKLFIDHDGIAWGEEWRSRINSSLAQTTFFIPIITPRYFMRSECRRELLEFAAKATSLGVEELLLPILYVETQNLSAENPDEAIALVARTQYVDWHNTRLLDSKSRDYRVAVNSLARRLLQIARSVAETQFDRELNADPDGDGTDGITDLVTKITALLPEWLDAVLQDRFTDAQAVATWDQYAQQVQKLRKRRAPASAGLAVQMRMAREMLPLAERAQRDARLYATRTIELDSLVSALARLVSEYPTSFPLVMPVREAIDEAMTGVTKGDNRRRSGTVPMEDNFASMRHLGRIFQKCYSCWRDKNQTVKEGNDIVRRWNAELKAPEERRTLSPSELCCGTAFVSGWSRVGISQSHATGRRATFEEDGRVLYPGFA